MGRITEAIMDAMISGQLLEKRRVDVKEDGHAELEVRLRKGREYIVRSKALNSRVKPKLSLVDSEGSGVFTYPSAGGRRFIVIPVKDGLYRIHVDAEADAKDSEPVTIMVTLSVQCMPGYARLHIAAGLTAEAASVSFADDTSEKDLPEMGGAGRAHLKDAPAMVCCGLTKTGGND